MKTPSNYPLNVKATLEHTLATRVSFEELSDIHAAASASGVTGSHWLREAAIAHLGRGRASKLPPLESTILAEIMALRLIVLNLYPHAIAGLSLTTLHTLMAYAESNKHLEVAKLLADIKGGAGSLNT
jgi:hypothetical protein